MSDKPNDLPYMSLASAVARLGGDERELVRAHVEGRLTLIGRLRDGSTLAGVPTPIPSHALAEWKPAGGGAMRLNLANNCIEANAGLANFAEFNRCSGYGYEDVQVAAHEVNALARSLNGRVTATAGAETKCRTWLYEKMSANPDSPEPKELCWDEAKRMFKHLSKRGFDRAWPGAEAWFRPGPRNRRKAHA